MPNGGELTKLQFRKLKTEIRKVTKNESTESILKLMNELARKRLNEVVGMKLKQLLKIE